VEILPVAAMARRGWMQWHSAARMVALGSKKKRPGEPTSAQLSQAKMLCHFLAYRWSRAVGCFEQRASRAEGTKNDAKHEFEPMRAQPSPRATLPNAP
jgi:hypothetical protein